MSDDAHPPDEQSADLWLWARNGCLDCFSPRPGLPVVSVGRTDSRRALGFTFREARGQELAAFVLDRAQVKALRDYLDGQLRRLKGKARR